MTIRKSLSLIGTVALSVFAMNTDAQVLVTNNGSIANIMPGCVVSVKTASVHNLAGEINNAGRITIEGDYINDDITTGGGALGVFNIEGNWENNATFTADQSQVNLFGANQLITGTVVSSFYDLVLNGSGIKSQTINAVVTNTLVLNDRELATNANKMSVTNTNPAAITFNLGFVSSTGAGRLERSTNSTSAYIYPLGSSTGTPRYRPLEITPTAANANVYGARLANVDATGEGFNRNNRLNLCDVNPSFYHQINRTSGSDAADLKFFFDPLQDGTWSLNAHWQNLPQWESMGTPVSGTQGSFNTLSTSAWNDFSFPAFALSNPGPTVSFSGLAPTYCVGASNATLSGSPSGGQFSGSGVTNPNGTFNPTVAGLGTHTITYNYTNLQGCTGTYTQDVVVSSGPTPTITPDGPLTICTGSTLNLDAGAGYTSYLWSPGNQNTQSIQVNGSGLYSVTVTNSAGCTGSSSTGTFVSVYPPTFAVITANGNLLSATPAVSYQWYFNGAQIPGATNQTYLATLSGNYQVEIVDSYGCTDISSIVEFSLGPNGVAENTALQSLMLYPNPGNGQFILSGSFSKFIKVTVSITDVLGQKLRADDEMYTDGMQKVYDLEDLANGVYFVRITTEDKEQRTIQYIKN